MYRVELKVGFSASISFISTLPFLMYRVELKAGSPRDAFQPPVLFLMYRVELKGTSSGRALPFSPVVPNVPCGVESCLLGECKPRTRPFLMYGVELKGKCSAISIPILCCS